MGSETISCSGYFHEQQDQEQSRNESNFMYNENRSSGGTTNSISSGSSSSSSSCGSTSGGPTVNQQTNNWPNITLTSTQLTQSLMNEMNDSHHPVPRNTWTFPSHPYQRTYLEGHYNNGEPVAIHHHTITQNSNQAYKRYFQTGKSGNSKDICGDDKHKEDGDPWNVDAPAAFLGPNLWDRTLPYDTDLKVHPYVDLDEFLSENGMPSVDGLPSSHLGHSMGLGHRSDSLGHSTSLSLGLGPITKRERSPSPSDCMSPDTMNPPSPADSNELKDDKYWARRRKNNMAAKRSRDARRMKENQIALRAGFLEKENMSLHRELEQLKQENMELRARLSKYQEV